MSLAPYVAQCTERDLVTKKFRFQINGTSDPDFQCPAGAVKDVVRNGVGVFTVYLPNGFRPLTMLGLVGEVLEATPAHDLKVKADLADFSASAGTFQITIVGTDGSTAAEDPVDNDWVYLEVTFAFREKAGTVGSV